MVIVYIILIPIGVYALVWIIQAISQINAIANGTQVDGPTRALIAEVAKTAPNELLSRAATAVIEQLVLAIMRGELEVEALNLDWRTYPEGRDILIGQARQVIPDLSKAQEDFYIARIEEELAKAKARLALRAEVVARGLGSTLPPAHEPLFAETKPLAGPVDSPTSPQQMKPIAAHLPAPASPASPQNKPPFRKPHVLAVLAIGAGAILFLITWLALRNDLTGTTWRGAEVLPGFGGLVFELGKNNEAIMTDARSRVKGRWSRNGDRVTISFQNCEYSGVWSGDEIRGTARYFAVPHDWPFSVRRENGPAEVRAVQPAVPPPLPVREPSPTPPTQDPLPPPLVKQQPQENPQFVDAGTAPIEDKDAEFALVAIGGKIRRSQQAKGQPIVSVDLAKSNATDEGMKIIGKLQNLQTLSLAHTVVTDKGVKELCGLKNLETLSLLNTWATDEGLKALVAFPRLRYLDLARTAVTDEGLNELAKIKTLETVNLIFTPVTPAGIERLRKGLPNCKFYR